MKKEIIFNNLLLIIICMCLIPINAFSGGDTLTFDDIYKRRSRALSPRGIYGLKSMNDGKSYCRLEKDSINVYSYKKGNYLTTLFSRNDLIPVGDTAPIPLRRYAFDRNENRVLLPTKTEYIFRYSSRSDYYIYYITEKKLIRLSENGKQGLASFSPDGSKVAFVRDNNIFIKDLNDAREIQITHDGEQGNIINGTSDWVYEEEFGFTKAFSWSPDGRKIAYYRFDESNVREYSMQKWGELYPENYNYKYPKTGEDNSLVTIHIYDLSSNETIEVDIGKETDQYIPRIKWTKDENILAVQRMNRLQNKLEILLAEGSTGKTRVIYTEDNKYYIDITDNLTFLDDKIHFIITSEKSGYNHIYLFNMEGEEVQQLTEGDWDVITLSGFDEKDKLVYYISAESSPLNREVYSADMNGHMAKVSLRIGTNKPSFSKTYQYYINNYSDVDTPPIITVNKRDGKEIRVLEDNADFLEAIKKYGFSKKELFSFKTSDTVELYGYKILPWNFDPNKKYPVLMYVYGGPGSQTVLNSWNSNLWYQFLAEQGIMIVSVDNRGTGARGEEFKKMTYMQLGKFETIDQIEAAKYLSSLDYVDSEHIGIFGWSYGGYMSTLCLTKGAEYFSVAVAVAPVTNWRYYDNIYTERYMRTPQENPDGYDDNSPINHVDKMEGKLLLVHGTGDDNVHVQNSMDLITALVDANKQFDLQLYPNKNHGIYGGNTTYHLYYKISQFLLENLKE